MRAGVGPNFIVVSVYVYTNSAYAHALHSADDFFDRAARQDLRNQFALPPVRTILKGSGISTCMARSPAQPGKPYGATTCRFDAVRVDVLPRHR
jgi:hypothetical protein